MKEKLREEEQLRKEVVEQAELEGARAELRSVPTELAELKETSSKYQEDALIEISQLQARAEDAERKLVGVPEEITTAKIAALAECQSSAEFQ